MKPTMWNACSGSKIVFAFHDAFKATVMVSSGTYLPENRNTSPLEERLGQADLRSTRYHQFVFFRQFIHTQDGDEVLQFLITLQMDRTPRVS